MTDAGEVAQSTAGSTPATPGTGALAPVELATAGTGALAPVGLAPVALAALVLAAHMVVALTHGGPVAVPDVPVYLSVAQWVAGGLPPPPFGYHPGYGLLLAPVALAGASPDTLHTAGLILNGLLAAGAVLLAAALARDLSRDLAGGPTGGLSSRHARWPPLAAAIVAALHPSLSAASRIAWAETLLTVLVLATAWALVRATLSRSLGAYGLGGALATIGVAAHPRMGALAVVAAAAVLFSRTDRRAIGAFTLGAVAGALVAAAAIAWAYTGESMGTRLLDTADPVATGGQPWATIAGQLTAIGASTAGLALIGLVEAARRSWSATFGPWFARPGSPEAATSEPDRTEAARSRLDQARLVAALIIGGGAVITIVVAGASLAGSDRADTLAYGRYADPYTVALAAFALAVWVASPGRHRLVPAWAAAVAAVAALVVWSNSGAVARPATRIMVAGTDLWWYLANGRLLPALAASTAVSLVGLAWWAGSRRWPPLGLAAMALVLVVMVASTVTVHRHLRQVGQVSAGQATAAAVIRHLGDAAPDCLAHDRTNVSTYVMWLYRMQLPDIEHRRVDLAAGAQPCSPWVVAHAEAAPLVTCDGATLLVDEPNGSWALWQLPPTPC